MIDGTGVELGGTGRYGRHLAVWYRRDNASMRASESVVFDLQGRDPMVITEALGGMIVVDGLSDHMIVHVETIELLVEGVGRRLGSDLHLSPPERGPLSDLARKDLDRVLAAVANDPDLREATFAEIVRNTAETWYARSAIEHVYLMFRPQDDERQRERFLFELGSAKLREFYGRLLEKHKKLAAWEAKRGPRGVRGLGIIPREHYDGAKRTYRPFLLWDPREHEKYEYDGTSTKWIYERVYQWLPPDRRWRPFQHKLDDLLCAVELQ